MLVDAINNRKPSGASESTVLGPFHVAGAPELPTGANICLDHKGEDMVISGRILDTDGEPIANALLDVWQANDEGFYDVQQKGIQPDFNLPGGFRTGPDGKYWFRAVKPKYYPIPDDGGDPREKADLSPRRRPRRGGAQFAALRRRPPERTEAERACVRSHGRCHAVTLHSNDLRIARQQLRESIRPGRDDR